MQKYVHMMMSMRMHTCMDTIHGNNSWNISRSVVEYDADILVLTRIENMEWLHEHACSEYMQAIEKLYMHMCTTIYNKNNANIVCNSMCTWWWVCACILAWTQFMETIHGTSVDRLSNTMNRCWWLYALKTWSEYMNKDAVNTCKQWWKYTCICVLQF